MCNASLLVKGVLVIEVFVAGMMITAVEVRAGVAVGSGVNVGKEVAGGKVGNGVKVSTPKLNKAVGDRPGWKVSVGGSFGDWLERARIDMTPPHKQASSTSPAQPITNFP